MPHQIISIGELLWDLLPEKTILGGAPANLAYRLNALGDTCHLISKVGNDQLGRNALEKLSVLGLNTAFIQQDDQFPTGTVQVNFDAFKNPSYTIVPNVAYDHIQFESIPGHLAQTADCIAFGTLAQRSVTTNETIYALLQSNPGAVKFLDVNLRKDCYNERILSNSLLFADILKINDQEIFTIRELLKYVSKDVPSLAEEISEKNNIPTILVTLAEYGVFLYNQRLGSHYIPGFEIKLGDPLGAGDAFSAAFLHNYLQNKLLTDCCIEGNRLGALVAMQTGATQVITQKDINYISKLHKRKFDPVYARYIFQES